MLFVIGQLFDEMRNSPSAANLVEFDPDRVHPSTSTSTSIEQDFGNLDFEI